MKQNQEYFYKCARCGELHYPRHYVCRRCGARKFTELPLEGTCTLITWTRTYDFSEGHPKPSTGFGIVQFPQGITALGQLNVESPTIGMKLQTTIGTVKKTIDCNGEEKVYQGMVFIEDPT